MTGYGQGNVSNNGIDIFAEIKGYNNRFLDITVTMPLWLSSLEKNIREQLSLRFKRGRIDVFIKIKEQSSIGTFSINYDAAIQYKNSIHELGKLLGLRKKPSIDAILQKEGIIEENKDRDPEKYRSLVEDVLNQVMNSFEKERQREGDQTAKHILSNLSILEENNSFIKTKVNDLEEIIKTNLKTRFEELLGSNYDENRILAETAVLLVKYSISEELSRLETHLVEFRHEVNNNLSPGKKLDFLCQEINREVNTIGSKTQMIEVTRSVVDMKEALENIREQLRNVE